MPNGSITLIGLARIMTHKQVEDYLLTFNNTKLDYPFGKEAAVYKVNIGNKSKDNDEWKMFAIVAESSNPVRLSLKCDPTLAVTLREKYETVLPGYHLNKQHWNTIILSGQLSWEEIKDLIRHSYNLVAGE